MVDFYNGRVDNGMIMKALVEDDDGDDVNDNTYSILGCRVKRR